MQLVIGRVRGNLNIPLRRADYNSLSHPDCDGAETHQSYMLLYNPAPLTSD
jgi:hypothetical protein